jgi:ankyrin repeat protein
MWVVLVVSMLNKAYDEGKVEDMYPKLHELPSDLDDLFSTILSKENPDKHETVLLLQWVLFAARPLRPEELYHAMLAGTSTGSQGEHNRLRITPDDIRRRITNSSQGLIEVRKESETVQFIHESVNDFLLRNQRLQTLDTTLESNPIGISHNRLRDICLSYLMMDALQPPKYEVLIEYRKYPLLFDHNPIRKLELDYPFVEYASMYIFRHIETAAGHVTQVEFLRHLKEEHGIWERLNLFHKTFSLSEHYECPPEEAGLIYMSAFRGYINILEILYDEGVDINGPGGDYGTALQAAAAHGHEAIVVGLLERNADVNLRGGYYDTALQAAVAEGHEAVVARLLERNADVNLYAFHGTALRTAASKGYEAIVARLLERNADVNLLSGYFSDTALHVAAAEGHEAIVVRLLERTADVNLRAGYYDTALQGAAAHGHEATVVRLLESNADVNLQGGAWNSALQAAVNCDHEAVVVRLLERGADVNLQGPHGTALQAAVIRGHEAIVTRLLERGADVNLQGPHGTALHIAVLLRHHAIAAKLLERGAIDAR